MKKNYHLYLGKAGHLTVSIEKVECSGLDLNKYIADFSDFPLVED